MKHNADTLKVILSCDSIRDARNLSHVSSDCCYRASRASLTAREAPCTHVCHMRVHSAKHRVPTALIIMKGPRATTHHRLLTPRPARLVWYSSADTSPGSTRTMLPESRQDRFIHPLLALPPCIACACSPNSCMPLATSRASCMYPVSSCSLATIASAPSRCTHSRHSTVRGRPNCGGTPILETAAMPALRRSTSASVARSREFSPSTHKRARCL
jgi:hypothetical protein